MTLGRRRLPEYAAFAGMSLLWGSTFLAIRVGNDALPSLWAATIRLVLAAPLLFLVARALRVPLPRGRALRGAALFGFLNLGVNFALLYWGEERVPSGIAAVLYATTPLTTGALAWLVGLERPRAVTVFAALLGLLGVCLIFTGEIRAGAPGMSLLAVFLAATAASASSVVLKRVPQRSPFVTNAVGALAGLPVCLLGSFLLGESHVVPSGVRAWAPVIYLVLAGNLGAFVLYAWLVSRWEVTKVSNVALVVPVIAVLLGSLVRGEAPTLGTYVGGCIVLAGVTLALRSKHP